jgi:glycine cleavage system aminomethyltransferase T
MTTAHTVLGAHMEPRSGWEIVGRYGDDAAERTALRESVGLGDVTPRGKIDVRGAITGPLQGAGGSILAQITDDWALVLTAPGAEPDVVTAMEAAAQGSSAMVTDATHLYAGLVLVGPAVHEVCARLSSWDPMTLDPGAATGASFGDIRAIVLHREASLPTFELYVATEFGRYAWETVSGVVKRLGGRPVGWGALLAEGWN